MLVRFKVANFLSFGDEQEFSMESGKLRSKMTHVSRDRKSSILKFAAIYGANSSGKSSLVNALDFGKEVVLSGMHVDYKNRYCRTKLENRDKVSLFEYTIKISKRLYTFGFEVLLNEKSVRKEWLTEILTNSRTHTIYYRDTMEGVVKIDSRLCPEDQKTLKLFADLMKSNEEMLFLTEMNRNKADLYLENDGLRFLQDISQWFARDLIINYPDSEITPAYYMDEDKLAELNQLFLKMGLGVSKVEIVDGTVDEAQHYIPANFLKDIRDRLLDVLSADKKKGTPGYSNAVVRVNSFMSIISVNPDTEELQIKKVVFSHPGVSTVFDIFEESEGTRRMLDLIEVLISAKMGRTRVYVIDEVDRCLHPLLTYRYIKEYLDSVAGSETQLIVTTHEAHLMDFTLIRADEIHFITNVNGMSEIKTLEEYNLRFDKRLKPSYFKGNYGGIPYFDEVFMDGDEI